QIFLCGVILLRLPDFIRAKTGHIVDAWEALAEETTPEGFLMSRAELRDHVHRVLGSVADACKKAAEESEKNGAAEDHADRRWQHGYSLNQLLAEYSALRIAALRSWMQDKKEFDRQDIQDIVKFNECIDGSSTRSTSRFVKKLDHAKDL